MPFLRVVDWQDRYEASGSRRPSKAMEWIKVPVKAQSIARRRIMRSGDGRGLMLIGAMEILREMVAVKDLADRNGVLSNSGDPLDAVDFADAFGLDATEKAIELILEMVDLGWLDIVTSADDPQLVSGPKHEPLKDLLASCTSVYKPCTSVDTARTLPSSIGEDRRVENTRVDAPEAGALSPPESSPSRSLPLPDQESASAARKREQSRGGKTKEAFQPIAAEDEKPKPKKKPKTVPDHIMLPIVDHWNIRAKTTGFPPVRTDPLPGYLSKAVPFWTKSENDTAFVADVMRRIDGLMANDFHANRRTGIAWIFEKVGWNRTEELADQLGQETNSIPLWRRKLMEG